ncbi:hypothetical protein VULLAG_LOCUS17411 [Vulpes lagopus]
MSKEIKEQVSKVVWIYEVFDLAIQPPTATHLKMGAVSIIISVALTASKSRIQ